MTSCLLVKAPDRLVAVSDGRLSLSDASISFETAHKIVGFTPRYRVPVVSVNRFSHFSEYKASRWYVAYAGTYALASEIIREFQPIIEGGLTIVWNDGVAELSRHFDQSRVYGDDYSFNSESYIKYDGPEILNVLREAVQAKANEWAENRGLIPDCEFLVFGVKEAKREYVAYKITVDATRYIRGMSVPLMIEAVADGRLVTIGSPEATGSAFADEQLLLGLQGWQERESIASGLPNLDAPLGERTAPTASTFNETNWSVAEVERRFLQIVRRVSDASVGGEILVARGGWHGEIGTFRYKNRA